MKAEKNTAEAYVDLAIAVGGASWALKILRESSITRNITLQVRAQLHYTAVE